MTFSQGNDELVRRVRATATEFIDEAFSELKRIHVLPVPWFAPHIRVGRDYYGDDMAGLKLSQPLGERTIYDGLYVPPRPLGEDTE